VAPRYDFPPSVSQSDLHQGAGARVPAGARVEEGARVCEQPLTGAVWTICARPLDSDMPQTAGRPSLDGG